MYAGDKATASRFVKEFPEKRIYRQIELMANSRKNSSYTRFRLFRILPATYARYLCNGKENGAFHRPFTSADLGRNYCKAVDFLAAYLGKDVSEWPYQQISGWDAKQQELCKDLYRIYRMNPSRKDILNCIRPTVNRKLKTSLSCSMYTRKSRQTLISLEQPISSKPVQFQSISPTAFLMPCKTDVTHLPPFKRKSFISSTSLKKIPIFHFIKYISPSFHRYRIFCDN